MFEPDASFGAEVDQALSMKLLCSCAWSTNYAFAVAKATKGEEY